MAAASGSPPKEGGGGGSPLSDMAAVTLYFGQGSKTVGKKKMARNV